MVVPNLPTHLSLGYGVCAKDLPQSLDKVQVVQMAEQEDLTAGKEWVKPACFQSRPWRKARQPVFVHMTVRQLLPTFEIKDTKNAQLTERGVTLHNTGDKIFIDLILARDRQEAQRTLGFNVKRLVWAFPAPEFRNQNPSAAPENDTFPFPRHLTFEALGMRSPSFQYDILINLTTRVNSALDGMSNGFGQRHARYEASLPPPPQVVEFIGDFVDDF